MLFWLNRGLCIYKSKYNVCTRLSGIISRYFSSSLHSRILLYCDCDCDQHLIPTQVYGKSQIKSCIKCHKNFFYCIYRFFFKVRVCQFICRLCLSLQGHSLLNFYFRQDCSSLLITNKDEKHLKSLAQSTVGQFLFSHEKSKQNYQAM